jgi:hypothetical protein
MRRRRCCCYSPEPILAIGKGILASKPARAMPERWGSAAEGARMAGWQKSYRTGVVSACAVT